MGWYKKSYLGYLSGFLSFDKPKFSSAFVSEPPLRKINE